MRPTSAPSRPLATMSGRMAELDVVFLPMRIVPFQDRIYITLEFLPPQTSSLSPPHRTPSLYQHHQHRYYITDTVPQSSKPSSSHF